MSDREKMKLKLWDLFNAGWNENYDGAEELIIEILESMEVTA